MGYRPSFIWRSILWGRQVIHKELRWRIENGENLQIYNTSWIPRPETFKILSQPTLPKEAKVSWLINEEHKWNENLIRQHFIPEDVKRIVQISLPVCPEPDQLLRAYDRHGLYSVKSGYQVALRLKFPNYPSTSKTSMTEWNMIWKLQIPTKIKIFMWRAAQNLLPTVENLWKKKVVQNPLCQRCSCKGENVFHALVECKASQKMSKLTKFEEDLKHLANQDMLSVLHVLTERGNIRDVELIVALCWAIWHSRNLFIFKRKKVDNQIVMAIAEATVELYRRVKATQRQDNPKQMSCWKPHPEGWFKLNVDAAIKSKDQCVGLGIAIRNHNGEFVVAAVKKSKFYGSVASAEAEAANGGLEITENAACFPLIVESDCQEEISLITEKKCSKLEINWTISETQRRLKRFNHAIVHIHLGTVLALKTIETSG